MFSLSWRCISVIRRPSRTQLLQESSFLKSQDTIIRSEVDAFVPWMNSLFRSLYYPLSSEHLDLHLSLWISVNIYQSTLHPYLQSAAKGSFQKSLFSRDLIHFELVLKLVQWGKWLSSTFWNYRIWRGVIRSRKTSCIPIAAKTAWLGTYISLRQHSLLKEKKKNF